MAKKALARIEEGERAASVALGCAALLDAGLAEQLGPATEEEEGLECGGRLAVRAARRLQALKHHLEVCQEALARIRDELHGWRRRRQRAREELYDHVKSLRNLCRGIFDGDEGDTFLGLRGTLPRRPKELHAACGPLARRLADVEWPMPEHPDWFKVDRDKVVRSLLEEYQELGRALDAIQEGETREAVAQVAKNRAAEAHKSFLGKSTRFLEIALELAGLDDLAAAVRPGVGRIGRPPQKKLAAAGPAAGAKALPAAGGGSAVAELAVAPADAAAGAGSAVPGDAGGPDAPAGDAPESDPGDV